MSYVVLGPHHVVFEGIVLEHHQMLVSLGFVVLELHLMIGNLDYVVLGYGCLGLYLKMGILR